MKNDSNTSIRSALFTTFYLVRGAVRIHSQTLNFMLNSVSMKLSKLGLRFWKRYHEKYETSKTDISSVHLLSPPPHFKTLKLWKSRSRRLYVSRVLWWLRVRMTITTAQRRLLPQAVRSLVVRHASRWLPATTPPCCIGSTRRRWLSNGSRLTVRRVRVYTQQMPPRAEALSLSTCIQRIVNGTPRCAECASSI